MTLVLALALLGAQGESPAALVDRAEALLQRNAAAEAMQILRPLLAQDSASGDQRLLLRARHTMAMAHRQANDYAGALDELGRALELSRALGDRPFEAGLLVEMGRFHKSRSSYAEALQACRGAIAIYEDLGDRTGAGRAFVVVGAVQDLRGEYRPALESYAEAKARLDPMGPDFLRLLGETAITYKNLGNYEEALAYYRVALEQQRRVGNKYEQAVLLSNMGVAYVGLGQHERAISHYEESLGLCRELNEKRGQGIVVGNLAESWDALGDRARALQYYEEQVRLTREIGSRVGEGSALKGLGDIRLAQGDLAQARQHLEAAVAILSGIGSRIQEALALLALSELSLREGQSAEARRLGEKALAIAQQADSPELEWKARLALARAGRGSDAAAALDQLRSAAAIVNGLRGRVFTDVGKIGYLETRQQLFHEMVDLLEANGLAAEALEAAEAARSRALSDLLAGREVEVGRGAVERLTEVRTAEARLRAQSRESPTEASVRAELTRTRATAEADLSQRLRSLQEEQPELASLVVAEPLSFAEITATARRLGATFVEYLVTETRLFIWVVGPDGSIRSASVGVERSRLREAVGDLHRSLNQLDRASLHNPQPVRDALAALHRLVVSPVARHLPRKREELVFVIPHDVLFLVPFAALVDDQGRYLAETHTFATAPSIGVLRYTAEKKRRVASPGQPRLLALADPRPPKDATVAPLPGARDEVRRLARRFPPDHRLLLFGADASEANGKRLGPGQTWLHFAVHGLFYDDRPWDSALLLAPGEGEDGWLKAGEVFGLDLRADLVVLSGCSTGLGKLSGDGILGLARAFLYAGTPSIVVSQWDVSDVATAFLMERFYDGLRAGRGKAWSLRSAQVRTLRRYPHPALWAGFTLIGEPR